MFNIDIALKAKRSARVAVLLTVVGLLIYAAKESFEPRYQDKSVDEWFADLYQEPQAAPAKAAFKALGKRGVRYCIAELKRRDSIVQKWLTTAAERMPWAAPYVPVARPVARQTAAHALEQIGTPAIPALVKTMRDSHPQVRFFACFALGRIQPNTAEGEAALVRALEDRAPEVTTTAVRGLLRLAPERPDLPQIFAGALSHAAPEVQGALATALSGLGRRSVLVLSNALLFPRKETRISAVSAVAALAPEVPERITLLLAATANDHPAVSAAALYALGEALCIVRRPATNPPYEFRNLRAAPPSAEAIATLTRAASAKPAQVRAAAISTITRVLWAHGHNAAILSPDPKDPLRQIIKAGLRDPDPTIRTHAAGGLKFCTDCDLEFVLALARDGEWTVKLHAIQHLGALRVDTPEVRTVLLASLGDSNENVQEASVGVLGALGDVTSLRRIIGEGTNSSLQARALTALNVDNDPVAREIAFSALERADTASAAAMALSSTAMTNPLITKRLLELLKAPGTVAHYSAAQALVFNVPRQNPEVIAILEQGLEEKDPWVRYVVATTLSRLPKFQAHARRVMTEALSEAGADADRWRQTLERAGVMMITE